MELTKEYFDQKLEGFVTKQYFEEYLNKTLDNKLAPIKEDIGSLKEDVGSLNEDFGSLKVKVNSIEIDVKEIREKVNRIDQRDLEDSNAFARTVVLHDTRISKIERKLKIRTPKPV